MMVCPGMMSRAYTPPDNCEPIRSTEILVLILGVKIEYD